VGGSQRNSSNSPRHLPAQRTFNFAFNRFRLNQSCYPDARGETKDTIFYTGAGRRGDQKLDSFNRAMFAAIETAHAVPLFNKLAVGRWQFTGFWRVTEGKYVYDETQKRMIWKFTLRKAVKN
jgi:hypothetical protein